MRSKLRELDPGLPFDIETWNRVLDGALFASRVTAVSLGVLGMMGAMLSITGIFGMAPYGQQAAAGVGNSRCPRRAADGSVKGSIGTGFQIAGIWFGSRIAPRNSGNPGGGVHRVSGEGQRSAGIGGFCCWQCRCWGSWLRGFQRNARRRLIL
jgi:hypothetical protein